MKNPASTPRAAAARAELPWWLGGGAGLLLVALVAAVVWALVWSDAARSVRPVVSFDWRPAGGATATATSYGVPPSAGVEDAVPGGRDLRSRTTPRSVGSIAAEKRATEVESPEAADRRELLLRREQRRDRQLAAFIRSAPAVPASWVSPLAVPYRITATFGAAGSLWSADHTGLDMAAPSGTPVAAVSAGTVTSAGDSGAYGLRVTITHPDGTQSMYAHLSRIDATVGEDVAAGDLIGAVGSTGNSTGPHLHLELRSSAGVPIDPVQALGARGVDL